MLQNSLKYGNNLWGKGIGLRPLDRVDFYSGQARGLSRVFIAQTNIHSATSYNKKLEVTICIVDFGKENIQNLSNLA